MTATVEYLRSDGPTSPQAILGEAIGADHAAVVVIAYNVKKQAIVTYSTMTIAELCAAAQYLQIAITERISQSD